MTKLINNAKTTALLTGLFVLILLFGRQFGTQGLIIAFLFGSIMNIVAYYHSDKIALASMRGKEVDEQSAPDLVHMIHRLATNAGLPMPRVYICPQDTPNAFATGRNPKHAAVAVTHGALELLTYDELEGVMAHELAHVKNRDTLTSCIAATIAGAIAMLASMGRWALLFGGFGGNSGRDDSGNALGAILMLILAPIAAMIIQMAISRSREFVADADGAAIAGTPWGLIHALQKLEAASRQMPMDQPSPAFNHLFIVNPLTRCNGLSGLFRTHPSTEERVEKLKQLG